MGPDTATRFILAEENCVLFLEEIRWHGVPQCSYCGSDRSTALPGESRYHCNNCNTTFAVTVKTLFHHTHLPLHKWFVAIALLLGPKQGASCRELAQEMGINKNTALQLATRIRKASADSTERRLLQTIADMVEAESVVVSDQEQREVG